METAECATDISLISNYSHYCESLTGDRWILVGDAGVFLDPIFSSGVHIGVSMAKFAASALGEALRRNVTLSHQSLGPNYEAKVRSGVKRFHSLIRMFYDSNFVRQMKKAFTLNQTRKAFTSVVAGDVWNDENFVFQKGVL